ncbi:MAG: hypothetical protein Fues2KO_25740 [Fuerstiella sp.]
MRRILLLMIALTVLPLPPAAADTPVRRRAAELLILKDQTRLFGLIANDVPGRPLQFLVRRQWLQQEANQLLQRLKSTGDAASDGVPTDGALLVNSDVAADVQWLQQYLKRLESDPDVTAEHRFYLQECLTTLTASDQANAETKLIALQIDRSMITRILPKPEGPRQLTWLALRTDEPATETATPLQLQRALSKRTEYQPPFTAGDIPSLKQTLTQDNTESTETQSARLQSMLFQADQRHGRTLQLIKIGNDYVSATGGQTTEQLMPLISRMLQGQIQSQLQELLQEPQPAGAGHATARLQLPAKLPESLQRRAATEAARVVEISGFDVQPANGTATVMMAAYHLSPVHNDWTQVASSSATAGRDQVTTEAQQQVADDPRVRQISQLFRQFGISNGQLSQATSLGAVVQAAQKKAQTGLNRQLDPTRVIARPQLIEHRTLGPPPPLPDSVSD